MDAAALLHNHSFPAAANEDQVQVDLMECMETRGLGGSGEGLSTDQGV